jgi:hypothetical protein
MTKSNNRTSRLISIPLKDCDKKAAKSLVVSALDVYSGAVKSIDEALAKHQKLIRVLGEGFHSVPTGEMTKQGEVKVRNRYSGKIFGLI